MRIGYRRQIPTLAIAGRPRIRPGTFGPDLGYAARVNPGDAAASRPDLDNIQNGAAYGIAPHIAAARQAISMKFIRDPGQKIRTEARRLGKECDRRGRYW